MTISARSHHSTDLPGSGERASYPDADPLSAARGIIIGLPIGLALWGLAWLVWRLIA